MQLASAYSVIANGGLAVKPVFIRRINDANGNKVFEAPPQVASEEQRVVPARNAFMTASLLQEVTRSGNRRPRQRPTQAPRHLRQNRHHQRRGRCLVCWLNRIWWRWYGWGTIPPRAWGHTLPGGSLALPAWINFMASALKGMPVAEIPAARRRGSYERRLALHRMGRWRLHSLAGPG